MQFSTQRCDLEIGLLLNVSTNADGEYRAERMMDLATRGILFLRNSSKQEQLDTNRMDNEAIQTAIGTGQFR